MKIKSKWVKEHLRNADPILPFSFLSVKSALEKIRCNDSDLNVDCINNSAYFVFRNVDFGEAGNITGFQAEVSAGIGAGWIELKLDSLSGPKIGMCQVSKRAVIDGKGIVKTGIYGASGVRDLFLVFVASQTSSFSISWFKFTEDRRFPVKKIGSAVLPEQVPYLGPLELNFLGSGLAGGGGSVDGIWDYLMGPSYSEGSYIDREEIIIDIEGREHSFDFELRRARGTGLFYGIAHLGNLSILLVDYTNMREPWVARFIRIYNNENGTPKNIRVKACIKTAGAFQNSQVKGQMTAAFCINNSSALCIEHKPETFDVMKSTNENASEFKSYATIAFTDVNSRVEEADGQYFINSEVKSMAPGEYVSVALYHYVHFDKSQAGKYCDMIRKRKPEKDIEMCMDEWGKWLKEGVSLDRITDVRARDIVEATTIIIKMQQGTDGGLMATPRTYTYSFMRDNHSALRGMVAAGHTNEAKMYLLWAESKFQKLKKTGAFPIANCAAINSDMYFNGFHNEDNWAAETPALYILIAKYYYEKTGDIKTLVKIEESLSFAMEIQLKAAQKFGWKLYFSGDETDSFGSGIPLKDTPLNGKTKSSRMEEWSMHSVMLCLTSLEFYIRYLKLTDRNEKAAQYEEYIQKLKDSLDNNFWREDLSIHDWYRGTKGEWPELRITSYTLMIRYFKTPLNIPERSILDIVNLKQYINERGFIPLQPGGLNDDFCGHTPGYLLWDLVDIGDELKEKVYQGLVYGGLVGCWGIWSESYTADGMSYGDRKGTYAETWDGRVHNMRPFESGVNLEAVLKYWGY